MHRTDAREDPQPAAQSAMLRKLAFGVFIVALVLFGILAQLGAYLFEMTPLKTEEAPDAVAVYGISGPHSVGLMSLSPDAGPPMPVMIWYPSADAVDGSTTYSYTLNVFGPKGPIALATYEGEAVRGVEPDLSTGPFPLVVLSPGFAIGNSSYAWLAEHLASYGFVVVSPKHDESLDPGVLWRSTIQRPQDVLSLMAYIDEQPGSGGDFDGLVDTDLVAVVGHSYGGYTAQATGGARLHTEAFQGICETAYKTDDPIVFLCDALLPRLDEMAELAGLDAVPAGLWPAWGDARVDAVVSMAGDAAVFGQPGLSEITVPVMAIGGTADTDSPYEWGTSLTFEHVSGDRRFEIALEAAQHMIFAGECETVRRIMTLVSLGFCSDLAWNRDQAHDLVKHYVTAFLLAELKDDQEASAVLEASGGEFPGVTHRAEGY